MPSFGGFGLGTGILTGFALRLTVGFAGFTIRAFIDCVAGSTGSRSTGIFTGFWLSGMASFRWSLPSFPVMIFVRGDDVSCRLFLSDIVFSILHMFRDAKYASKHKPKKKHARLIPLSHPMNFLLNCFSCSCKTCACQSSSCLGYNRPGF